MHTERDCHMITTAPVLQIVATGFLLLSGSLTSGSKHQSARKCPHEEDLQHSPTLTTKKQLTLKEGVFTNYLHTGKQQLIEINKLTSHVFECW